MKGRWIEDLAWPEVAERLAAGWPVIAPIGARAKEHGHHLPMQTDYLLARALCDGLAKELPVLVAPVVDFGYYPAFIAYPGSQHLRAETFIALLEDVLGGLFAHGAEHVFIVNTGVSTEGPVQIAVRNIFSQLRKTVAVADIRRLGKSSDHVKQQKLGGHGDEHETSLMLAIAPDKVNMSKAQADYGNMLNQPATVFYQPAEFSGDPKSGHHYSATGVRGDPTLATAEKGRAILDAMVADLVAGVRALYPSVG
ncbi:creatininase family protein [Terrarubrum flagellatum]|uniref:creatininase family protein n=1 Tax=Terrirubrum flagellatum TaxID=2895980 RepID=UPI0031450B09